MAQMSYCILKELYDFFEKYISKASLSSIMRLMDWQCSVLDSVEYLWVPQRTPFCKDVWRFSSGFLWYGDLRNPTWCLIYLYNFKVCDVALTISHEGLWHIYWNIKTKTTPTNLILYVFYKLFSGGNIPSIHLIIYLVTENMTLHSDMKSLCVKTMDLQLSIIVAYKYLNCIIKFAAQIHSYRHWNKTH